MYTMVSDGIERRVWRSNRRWRWQIVVQGTEYHISGQGTAESRRAATVAADAARAILVNSYDRARIIPGKRLATEEVAAFFRSRADGAFQLDGKPPEGYELPTLAPAAFDTFAHTSIAGDLPVMFGPKKWGTEDFNWKGNAYRWYDLSEVKVRGVVYRISCTGTKWSFVKVCTNVWIVQVSMPYFVESREPSWPRNTIEESMEEDLSQRVFDPNWDDEEG